ncbi:XRE family transcriptional regulator, partial [bacterium]
DEARADRRLLLGERKAVVGEIDSGDVLVRERAPVKPGIHAQSHLHTAAEGELRAGLPEAVRRDHEERATVDFGRDDLADSADRCVAGVDLRPDQDWGEITARLLRRAPHIDVLVGVGDDPTIGDLSTRRDLRRGDPREDGEGRNGQREAKRPKGLHGVSRRLVGAQRSNSESGLTRLNTPCTDSGRLRAPCTKSGRNPVLGPIKLPRSPQNRGVSLDHDLVAYLRRERGTRGFSLRALAAQTGVSKSTLGAWERGTHLPSLPELDAVLTLYGVDVEERMRVLSLMDAPRARREIRRTEGGDLGPAIAAPGAILQAMRVRRGRSLVGLGRTLGVDPT